MSLLIADKANTKTEKTARVSLIDTAFNTTVPTSDFLIPNDIIKKTNVKKERDREADSRRTRSRSRSRPRSRSRSRLHFRSQSRSRSRSDSHHRSRRSRSGSRTHRSGDKSRYRSRSRSRSQGHRRSDQERSGSSRHVSSRSSSSSTSKQTPPKQNEYTISQEGMEYIGKLAENIDTCVDVSASISFGYFAYF